MKRVICLYRVSTVGQVDHDDIPMQKKACREYVAQHPDWEIVDEISEKGVSGYKVSTNARDAMLTWVERYDKATVEAKHMIIAALVERIEIGENYEVRIQFKVSAEQFIRQTA